MACSGKPSGPDAAQLAANAAKTYYEQLLKGDYGSFVDGRYQPTWLTVVPTPPSMWPMPSSHLPTEMVRKNKWSYRW